MQGQQDNTQQQQANNPNIVSGGYNNLNLNNVNQIGDQTAAYL